MTTESHASTLVSVKHADVMVPVVVGAVLGLLAIAHWAGWTDAMIEPRHLRSWTQ